MLNFRDVKSQVHCGIKSGLLRVADQSMLKSDRSKSDVWNRFDRVFEGDVPLNYVICRICETIYAHEMKNGTSSLMKHKCLLTPPTTTSQRPTDGSSAPPPFTSPLNDVIDEIVEPVGVYHKDDDDGIDASHWTPVDQISADYCNGSAEPAKMGSSKRKASKNQPIRLKWPKNDDGDQSECGEETLDHRPYLKQKCEDSMPVFRMDQTIGNQTYLPNFAYKTMPVQLSPLEKTELRTRIAKNEAETQYWKTMTAKADEEVKKLLLEQLKLRKELGLVSDT